MTRISFALFVVCALAGLPPAGVAESRGALPALEAAWALARHQSEMTADKEFIAAQATGGQDREQNRTSFSPEGAATASRLWLALAEKGHRVRALGRLETANYRFRLTL